MSDTILPVAKTDALQEDIAEFGLDILQTEEVGDLLCSHEALRATVAALTAENAHLREALTLGLGEQESVIAGLRAENERLDRAQRDHFTLREELRIACETGMRLNLPAEQIVARVRDSLGADAARFAIRDRESRAALPSSRETTDGRTDPS